VAAERIRATLSMTDQVTSVNMKTQDDRTTRSLNGFIFDLRAQFEFQDSRFNTRQIYDGQGSKSILLIISLPLFT
jgi:hypothetical protein